LSYPSGEGNEVDFSEDANMKPLRGNVSLWRLLFLIVGFEGVEY
jgi:hypothetical protein